MAELGEGVLAADGSIDRARVADVVFADRAKLDFLEQLLHPRVAQEYLTWRDQLGELPNPPPVSVTEVPLLYETGGDKRFDKVVVITAPAKLREQRRRVAPDDRESRLLPDKEKVQRADYSYVNTGTLAGARRLGRAGDGRVDADMSRLGSLALVVLILGGFALYVFETEPRWYERLRYPLRYEQIVTGHAENYDLDPQLVAAVIYQESKFDADAVSSSGAVGLMQLLPETAQGIADRTGGHGWHESDLVDPELNVRYGSWYLRHLLDKYGNEELALAAYNAGQSNVDRWRDEGTGIQFAETRRYVERVQKLKRDLRRRLPLGARAVLDDARRLIRRARSAGRDPEARRRSFARSQGRWRRS